MAEENKETEESIENDKKESAVKRLSGKLTTIFKKISLSKKSIIIIAVSFIVLISITATAWFFFFKSSPEEDLNKIALNEELAAIEAGEQEIVFEDIVDLEPFERIALKPGSTMQLITINLSLELTDQRYRKQIFTMEGRIRKIITGQVAQMTWLELRSPEGKIMLKYNLLKRINSIFPKLTIRNIYFTYFIMQ